MTTKKITRAFVTHHNLITMEQILPSGRKVWATWGRLKKDEWLPSYKTDSAYHICPYDGAFKDCKTCDMYDEDGGTMFDNCMEWWNKQKITDEEMASRATACANAAGCTIKFGSVDG